MSAPTIARPVRTAVRVPRRSLGNTTPIPPDRRRRRWLALPIVVALAIVSLVALAPAVPDEPLWDQLPPPQPGFADATGYSPVAVTLADGTTRPAKPSGDCSGPWAGEPFGFAPVCQVHDHGYEVLRAAAADGEPVDPQVRKQVDAMFAGDLRAHCAATQSGLAEVACHVVRRVATGAVQLNSWRQGYGVPGPEPIGTWLLGAVMLATAVAGLGIARRRLRAPFAALAAATPAGRDRYADALRAVSLLVVVIGHWTMMVVTRTPDGIEVDNLLALVPALQPATWVLQVMPVFFLVGGFANLATWRGVQARGGGLADYLAGRIWRLVVPAAAFAAVWVVAVPALSAVGVASSSVGLAARVAAQPLWFLGVYLAVTALVPMLAALHDRYGLRAVVSLAGAVVAVDLVRFGVGWPGVGLVNYALVWLCIQQLGFFYADGNLTATTRRQQLGLILAGAGSLAVLTGVGPYPVSMVGIPGANMSNMTPPTAAILALATLQLGIVLAVRPSATRWLSRPRVWTGVVVAGSLAMSLFLWHLTAAVAVVGFADAADLPLAAGGTQRWWLERPLWLAALAVIVAPVALLASRLERWRRTSAVRDTAGSRATTAAGSAMAVAGFAWLATNGFARGGAGGLGALLLALASVAWAERTRSRRRGGIVPSPCGPCRRRPDTLAGPGWLTEGRLYGSSATCAVDSHPRTSTLRSELHRDPPSPYASDPPTSTASSALP